MSVKKASTPTLWLGPKSRVGVNRRGATLNPFQPLSARPTSIIRWCLIHLLRSHHIATHSGTLRLWDVSSIQACSAPLCHHWAHPMPSEIFIARALFINCSLANILVCFKNLSRSSLSAFSALPR